jgi:hypothetical protein
MPYQHLRSEVANRGRPPDSFLEQLVNWGRSASQDIFARNDNYDIYSSIAPVLGPWQGDLHRRAVMLEVMRVLAGFESSWDWEEGRDTSNPESYTPATTEAGAWQVSADSMGYSRVLRNLVIRHAGSDDPISFQNAMKTDHQLAMEYVARLLRITVNHHGPIKHQEIHEWLREDAIAEFIANLEGASPTVNYRDRLPKPSRAGINQGLTSPSAGFMSSMLGMPRDRFTGDCQDVSDPAYERLVETRTIGPIRVTGLKTALSSLEEVLNDVKSELPDLYYLIGTEGMLCCRFKRIRGRIVREPSNHSWGTAVDLTIGGVLDEQGDDLVQRGLLVLSRYFNAHGWYWGAAFPTEDAMHFEVSREQLIKWRDAGMI